MERDRTVGDRFDVVGLQRDRLVVTRQRLRRAVSPAIDEAEARPRLEKAAVAAQRRFAHRERLLQPAGLDQGLHQELQHVAVVRLQVVRDAQVIERGVGGAQLEHHDGHERAHVHVARVEAGGALQRRQRPVAIARVALAQRERLQRGGAPVVPRLQRPGEQPAVRTSSGTCGRDGVHQHSMLYDMGDFIATRQR